jgi:clathrin heavy chain
MRKTAYLPLIAPFLKSVQSANNQAVNEALNQIHLQNEDYEELRRSVTQYENFDPINLAKETEGHEIVEFRRISAYLYRKIGKYAESIVLSKQDEMYRVNSLFIISINKGN